MLEEGTFQSGAEPGFYQRRWTVASTRANLIIVHGFREHCARYDHVAESFNQQGYNVYSYDQRGHGKSPGAHGAIVTFDDFISDLESFLEQLAPDLGGRPTAVLAHSMGGLVFTRYLQTRSRFRPGAVVFSSAFLELKPVSPILLALADVLSAVTPWLPVANLEAAAISRIPEEVKVYKADPLNGHGPINARTGAQLSKAVNAARAELNKISAPLLIVHGSADRLVPPGGSRLLYTQAKSTDKTLQIYEGAYHELLNDHTREEVKTLMISWLNARLGLTT